MDNNTPVKPFRFLSPLVCPKCNKLSIELYDIKGNPVGLMKMLDLEASGIKMNIDINILSHMKCTLCKEEYMLSWDPNGSKYPRPLRDPYTMNTFLTNTYNTTLD